MKPGELRQLAELAGLVADRDLARLGRARAEGAALAAAAETLAKPSAATMQETAFDAAALAGAGPLWRRWRQQELTRLQAARARLAAREALLREEARTSYGRKLALAELAARFGGPKR